MLRAPSANGSRVLVTGARGFLGSHLVQRLTHMGVEVHATSRRDQDPDAFGVRWWRVDLGDLDAVRELFQTVKPDTVFHLAGLATSAPDLALVPRMFRSNLATTVTVLTAAAEEGCSRLVLSQSLTEPDGPQIAGSPYAVSKWAATGYARMFHALYGLPVVILRVFMTYGPAQADVSKLIPYVTLSLLRGDAPELTSGRSEMDWVYVDDVVEGFVAAARAGGVEGRTVDIGTGRLSPVRAVVERLVKLTDSAIEPSFGTLPDRPGEVVRAADTARAGELIGWRPRIELDEGLSRTVAWYRDQLETGAL